MGLLILVALGATACGDDAPPPPPLPSDSEDLIRCDVASDPCQRGIYNSVAARLEAEDFGVPNIRTITPEQHEDEVRSGLDLNDLAGDDPASRGLRLLGFLPPATDSLTGAQAEYFINNVAAYYSRGSRSITIIDREYRPGVGQLILAHEFVHAIQDRQFDLSTVGNGDPNEDAIIAVRSVIEGDANFSSYSWYYDIAGVNLTPSLWEEELESFTDSLRERVADPTIALIDTASSFPYSYGYRFMTNLALAGGLDARAGAFVRPPATTAEVISGSPDPATLLDLPGAVHPAPLAESEVFFEERAGAWYVYGFLVRQGVEDEDAWAAALRWAGDEYAIYETGDEVAAVWRVRFKDDEGAQFLNDQVNDPEASTARSAVLFGDDVYVFAAETSESLVAWAAQPLDEMTVTAAVFDKGLGHGGISSGGCLLPVDYAATPRALHAH